jgi:hypothetical protein
MAFQGANIILPVFSPTDPANITDLEWDSFEDEAMTAWRALNFANNAMDPNYVNPAMNPAFAASPADSPGRLFAAMGISVQLANLNNAYHNMRNARIVNPPPAPVAPAAPAAPAALAAPAAPAAPVSRHKATPPSEYHGKTNKAKTFMNECENYFVQMPMNDELRIRAVLQLMKDDAAQWKDEQLEAFNIIPLPFQLTSWINFKAAFRTRFYDPREVERAQAELAAGKIKQTTSVRIFVDQIREKTSKAGWGTDAQRMSYIRLGLKPEVRKAVAGQIHPNYEAYVQALIHADEELQDMKGSEKNQRTGTSKEKKEEKPNNSKYRLTEDEKKEHMDKHLCFKCHKTGHSSSACKNPRTVYAEVKKTSVANVEETKTEEASTSKGKAKATEDEDFPESE